MMYQKYTDTEYSGRRRSLFEEKDEFGKQDHKTQQKRSWWSWNSPKGRKEQENQIDLLDFLKDKNKIKFSFFSLPVSIL